MQALQDELIAFTAPSEHWVSPRNFSSLPERHYGLFHRNLTKEHGTQLVPFLRSTMDELRLLEAEKYAKSVLTLADHDDAMAFRAHVLRRETLQDMAYEKQRDHTAHTLNNYLLGWYFFSHCRRVEDAMRPHFKDRAIVETGFTDDSTLCLDFGQLWTFVSLLHDVGYAFEGIVKAGGPPAAPAQIQEVATDVERGFASVFDAADKPDLAGMKAAIEKLTGVVPPTLAAASLADVSDSLRNLGDLSTIWTCAIGEKPEWKDAPVPPSDAFEAWKAHYCQFNRTMVSRIETLEVSYKHLYEKELPDKGIQILDHGVIGAFLLLAHSTLYFRITFGLKRQPDGDPLLARMKKHFNVGPHPIVPYHAHHWWSGVVWATAAVAIHNIQQSRPWPGFSNAPEGLLTLDQDPLAYLGILVDILQEWDRPKSSRKSYFQDLLPISSRDCRLGTSRGKVLIGYGCQDAAERVEKSLNGALDGWRDLVEIR